MLYSVYFNLLTSLVGLYYGITIAIVSFATAMTVLTLNIHHGGNSGREVPSVIRTVCLDYLAKLFCINVDLHEMRNTSQVCEVAFRCPL